MLETGQDRPAIQADETLGDMLARRGVSRRAFLKYATDRKSVV